MQRKTTATLLLASLLAGGAWAQTASATSDVPVKAGEASTQTRGQPNMATAQDPAAPSSTAVMGASSAPLTSASGAPVSSATTPAPAVMGAPGAREVPLHHATVTANSPTKAGEASTMTGGVPNMSTQNPVTDGHALVVPPVQAVQDVPQQAGEASTMVGGRPNADPNDSRFHR